MDWLASGATCQSERRQRAAGLPQCRAGRPARTLLRLLPCNSARLRVVACRAGALDQPCLFGFGGAATTTKSTTNTRADQFKPVARAGPAALEPVPLWRTLAFAATCCSWAGPRALCTALGTAVSGMDSLHYSLHCTACRALDCRAQYSLQRIIHCV